MTDAARVPSPCISVCRIEPSSGLCEGCLRTLDEIAQWGAMNDQARREVLHAIDARRGQRAARADAASGTRSTQRCP